MTLQDGTVARPFPFVKAKVPSYNPVMSPSGAFASDDAVALAVWLLDEVERGLVPVWPSTPRYAARIVAGLETLARSRPDDVRRAIMSAPSYGAIRWQDLLAHIR